MSSSAILLFLVALFLSASPACHGAAAGQQQPGHNITDILLAANPNFADFSSALAGANLTAQIDGRRTVTVLAVDNAAVAQLKARRLAPDSLAHVLSLHVLLDYYDDARLRQLNGSGTFNLVATLYQASGAAPGSAGLVNVSAAAGRVSFLPSGSADPVFYQKSIKESGYDISVLQVSGVFSSPAAEGKAAPATPPPSQTPAPSPAPVAAAAPAPVAKPAPSPAPAPAPKTEAPAPSPKGTHPAPPPKQAPDAPAPEDAPADEPPADQQKNAASGTEEWSLGAPVAAVVLAVVFLMW